MSDIIYPLFTTRYFKAQIRILPEYGILVLEELLAAGYLEVKPVATPAGYMTLAIKTKTWDDEQSIKEGLSTVIESSNGMLEEIEMISKEAFDNFTANHDT